MTARSLHILSSPTTATPAAFPGLELWELGRLIALAESAELLGHGSASVDEAVAFAIERCSSGRLIATSSLDTFARTWRGFAHFVRLACSVTAVGSVDVTVVAQYLQAPTRSKMRPSAATQQLRRSALRFLFRLLRENGLADHDPTMDVEVPHRTAMTIRALTDDEIEFCRRAAPATLVSTREPAAWALLEAGGSPGEIGNVMPTDVYLDSGMVLLAPSTRAERIVPLTAWGAVHLRRRLQLDTDTDAGWLVLASQIAEPNGRRTRATELVRNVMRRAGVRGDGVHARSVTAWAGRQVLAETGRVEDVAVRLGLPSLDAAAALIGHRWDEL